MTEKPIRKIADLKPDNVNANDGTERGAQLIEDSLREYGAGRSILLDKNGRIISGNHVAIGAGTIGIEDIVVVQTTGDKLVAVQRMDLDLDDPKTREMAIADNRAAEVNISFNPTVLAALERQKVNLGKFWSGQELETMAQRFASSGEDNPGGDEKTVECPKCQHEFVPPKGPRSPRLSLNERMRRAKPPVS